MNELVVKVSDLKGNLQGFVCEHMEYFMKAVSMYSSAALRLDKDSSKLIIESIPNNLVAEMITEAEMYKLVTSK